ncbi:MAG: aminotransferase class III-fold pyridoxal phosphate-dependent enzyme [Dehalococcoidia bacterium]|nr:aminotransferase class III-fold pyridoxal phosphate-dependent enzyme [Dehalococcoidia bacterium]
MTLHEGYDVQAELTRYRFADVERNGHRLNRGTARPGVAADEPPEFEAVRSAHRAWMVETTLGPDSPVIELDQPTTGVYVASRRGVYLDLYLGVAQRLFDDARLAPRLEPLRASGLLLRREINTDDFLGFAPEGVRLPQDLAQLVAGEMGRAFPRPEGYGVFFSNSGTEAVEAAIKASTLSAYRRVLERHGEEAWAAVCAELGIELDTGFGTDAPVWRDYPLFCIALRGAFHGRSLGSLALTKSRPVQRIGFPMWRWRAHTSPQDPVELEALVDRRPLADLLAEPGALRRTVADGRVPLDLLAAAVFEPMQGEGGYRMPSPAVLAAMRQICDDAGAQLVADEVQTFARGGTTFFSEGSNVRPDIVCLAKAAIVGMTIIPASVMRTLRPGWHSNTFGSGRLFDVNYAYAVIDTYLNGAEPTFAGLSFRENEQVKGDCLRQGLEALAEEFPHVLSEVQGRGSIWGVTVTDRPAFLAAAWRQGAKLLGAGGAERPGRVRLILPADVLTKEVDDVVAVLRNACRLVSS